MPIPILKDLGKQIEGAFTARREAKQYATASQKKYGTVKEATRTRDAKKAYERAQQQNKILTRLIKERDKKEMKKHFGLMEV